MSDKFKVLVVDDDATMRDTLKGVLLGENFDVFLAEDGTRAKQFLLLENIDFVLSDIEMPYFNGIDLLEWIKKNKPTSVMLMTGFLKKLEEKRALELGADEFLPKPFDLNELISKINKHLVKSKNEEELGNPQILNINDHYCKVPIEDFVSEKNPDYGVYIKVSTTKYIKIVHEGGKLLPERIETLMSKGINYLYIKKEDFHKLVGFTVLLSKAMTNVSISNEKKARFLKYTGEVVLEQVLVSGINRQSFRASREFVLTTIETISKNQDLLRTLDMLNEHSDYLYAHSVAVSLYSIMIAQELGYKTPRVLFNLALGGLFHDVGKKEIPSEILAKPRHSLTFDDVKLIESHVKRGKEIIESFPEISTDVVHIVYDHHEDLLGQGYPRGLSGNRIHPLAQIVCVADRFCEYTLKESFLSQVVSPQVAITKMAASCLDGVNKQAFMCLHRLVSTQLSNPT